MEYIIVFTVAIILMFIADNLKNKNKEAVKVLLIIEILLISVFAGMRSQSVGTDLLVYVKPIFNDAVGFDSLFRLIKVREVVEPLYLLLNFIVTRFTSNFNVLLFIIHFIIMTCVVKGLYDFKDRIPMWFGLSIFLLTFFNRTLNITRQAIAIFIIFANLKLLFDKKYWKYALAVLIAYGFHNSVIITLILIPLNIFKDNKKMKFVIYTCICMVVLLYEPALNFLYDMGIITERYINYLNVEKFDISISDEFLRIFFIAILLFTNARNKKITYFNQMLDVALLDIILMQLGVILPYAGRISLYFFAIYPILIPYSIKTMKKNGGFLTCVCQIILMIYWIFSFIYLNRGGTYPYITYFNM